MGGSSSQGPDSQLDEFQRELMRNLNSSEAVALVLSASMVKLRSLHKSKKLAVVQLACTEEGQADRVPAKVALVLKVRPRLPSHGAARGLPHMNVRAKPPSRREGRRRAHPPSGRARASLECRGGRTQRAPSRRGSEGGRPGSRSGR